MRRQWVSPAGCLLALLQLLGCATTGRLLWPMKERTHTFSRTTPVDVSTVPTGAALEVDGRPAGVAPASVAVAHRVERTYYRQSRKGLYLGCLADTTPFFVAIARHESDYAEELMGVGLGLVLFDCLPWFLFWNWDNLKSGVAEEIIPGRATISAHWLESTSSSTSITVPGQRSVTVTQRPPATFDAALLSWVSGSDLDPETDTLLRAGKEQLRLARTTGRRAQLMASSRLLRRYLLRLDATPAGRQEAQLLLRTIEANP
jgi:hypothetical protein